MSNNELSEYDKKFQEDLEKAIALSLETSEYEKFRNERGRCGDINGQETPSSHSAFEMFVLKPRPRPEPYSTVNKVSTGLLPPPNSQRKNSAPTTTCVIVDDLISFNSPTKDEKKSTVTDRASATNGFSNWESDGFGSEIFGVKEEKAQKSIYPNLNQLFLNNASVCDNPVSHNLEQSNLSGLNKSSIPVLPLPQPVHVGFKKEYTDIFHNFNARLPVAVPQTPVFAKSQTHSSNSAFNLKSIAYNTSTIDVLKVVGKRHDNNLIDLLPDNQSDIKPSGVNDNYSVLDVFDPLATTKEPSNFINQNMKVNDSEEVAAGVEKGNNEEDEDYENEEDDENDAGSMCSGYDPFYPFDYMYAPTSIDGSQGDPVYAAVVNNKPPALPTRECPVASRPNEKQRRQSWIFEKLFVIKKKANLRSTDLESFFHMVKELRQEFVHTDICTNAGLIISPTIESNFTSGTSVKVIVHSTYNTQPVPFTCDLSTNVEHIIVQVICTLENDMVGTVNDYVLKVYGLSEYLTSDTCLGDYEYVHQCMKLEKDVALYLMKMSELKRPLARTARDDAADQDLTLEDLLPNEPVQPISHEALVILLETIEREMDKTIVAARSISSSTDGQTVPNLPYKAVEQAIKAVCALMGQVETIEITDALLDFANLCKSVTQSGYAEGVRTEITSDDGNYSHVRVSTAKSRLEDNILKKCEKIREAVSTLIESYSHAFNVDFQLVPRNDLSQGIKSILEFQDTVIVHVGGLHRLNPDWEYTEYFVAAQIYHGTRPVKSPCLSKNSTPTDNFYKRVAFDAWLTLEGTTIDMLPRESRLVIVLYGQRLLPPEHERSKECPNEPQYEKVELGWSAIQFFNYEGVLTQGNFLLSLWPPIADKRFSPAPMPGTHPLQNHPVLRINLPEYGGYIKFPKLSESNMKAPMYEFSSLDNHTQQELQENVEQDVFSRPNVIKREVLWEKRHYLHNIPNALPKVLLAAQCWDYCSLSDLHAMLYCWSPMEPLSALQLLLPCFPDSEVRSVAITWIKELGSDELIDYLPQLVQALKHETYDASHLAKFLLERALTSPRVAHHLYWLLVQTLPGSSPQNSSDIRPTDDASIGACRYHRRLQIMLRALLAISGEALRQRFLSQQLLVKTLYEVAENVKKTKEPLRLKTLQSGLEYLHHSLQESSTSLPLSPSVCVVGVQVRTCSYFPSNTLPLKINFISDETRLFPAIFKVGDYLQQDMLTIQMIRIMDKLWLKEGLDLKMVTFACVPTGHKRGMIEMVDGSETLRKIQVEHGLTGSFKDRPIAAWLAKHNPSTLEYERAVWNFTASCAGYSVATYILGICDRHNDNIMLKTSGHLFHIDFGKFLGDAQMFGNFKRDRSPFVLTSDMAYVINGGDKPSQRFHHFVDLCCQAFAIVRKNGNLILNLFGLMVSSGIPGVTSDAVRYVQKALLPDKSNPEASAMFARMIDSSLKSWFTQFNFFLHNLSQLRFTGDHNDAELLSFVPKRYTLEDDGRIKRVQVYGVQKRYDPEKYYTYILRVDRVNQAHSTYLFRTYREFCEFHQKLCTLFPLANCHSLPAGIQIGRSNIKQVAERRKIDIEKFLVSLFKMADEISHSDIVYTFFHPLLRDEEESDINSRKVKVTENRRAQNESHIIRGQLKLSIQYQRETLMVMVHHARGLPKVNGGQEPSTYVKVYLKPDSNKSTKRKTKVVRKNCHPTFMEMLEYRMGMDLVYNRTLVATVWSYDPLQENEFLGGVTLRLCDFNLTTDTCEWFSLGNVSR